MKYLKTFNKLNESTEHFSLTDKYKELSSDVLLKKTGDDNWLVRTPKYIKLLSLISSCIDSNISEYFELDDHFFNALENEYKYSGFTLTRNEIKDACYKLREEGYLK